MGPLSDHLSGTETPVPNPPVSGGSDSRDWTPHVSPETPVSYRDVADRTRSMGTVEGRGGTLLPHVSPGAVQIPSTDTGDPQTSQET